MHFAVIILYLYSLSTGAKPSLVMVTRDEGGHDDEGS